MIFRSPPYDKMLHDYWVSRVINRPFVWEMGNPIFCNRNFKSKCSSFKSKNFWINSKCEYLGRTGYFDNGDLFSGKPPLVLSAISHSGGVFLVGR